MLKVEIVCFEEGENGVGLATEKEKEIQQTGRVIL